MTGELRAPMPLRLSDPRRLGPYDLLGRLGEGGMGTVYLARGPQGVPVAVKVVRSDLDLDGEFRRRFRSEVNRARQVPPFCTAEVLDADPDHEYPYLVVEYVDAPSLAEVVQERGPLSAANLHSVAIGVATALTAIHGAGVIHRDLKPRNVLLAPGSPKVIDFGIARAMEATSAHTSDHQMVGTVAYMAPERFGFETGTTLTTAADVFAWGAVVAYAGTGRTPFQADSPPATAARILTQPPDLSGLSGPLRSLVGHSLEKQPADRPTSRELLDLLLASGAQRSPATVAALAHQPGLRAAAHEAQAADDHDTGRQLTAMHAPVGSGERDDDTSVHESAARTAVLHTDAPGAQFGDRFHIPTQASPAPISPAGPTAVSAAPAGRKRRWVFGLAVLLLVGALLAGVLAVRGVRLPGGGAEPADATNAAPLVVTTKAGDALLIQDSLLGPPMWTATESEPERADCQFGDGLIARRERRGSYRCDGPDDDVAADQRVDVGVRLLSAGSCASIWFRFSIDAGHQVRICHDRVLVGWHKSQRTGVYRTLPLAAPIVLGAPSTRFTVSARGNVVEVARDGALLGTVLLKDPDLIAGKVVLGIFTEEIVEVPAVPYAVAFNDVKIWDLVP